jgi:Divergent InlB B-repeat domain
VSTAAVAVHELVHTLGAVSGRAPNECSGESSGHVCDAEDDLMFPRVGADPLAAKALDIGRDDYYGHSGGWFDLQDSTWLLNAAAQLPLTVGVAGQGRVAVGPVDPGCATGCVVEWDGGAQLTLTADPVGGTRFAGWSGACAGRARVCRVTMDAAKSATATFRDAARVTVRRSGLGSVSSAPGGISCGRTCSAVFFAGQTVTLRARAASGWRFVRWTGACRSARTTCTLRAVARGSVATATFRRRR